MKTYSVALLVRPDEQGQDPYWVTNWYQYYELDNINWDSVKEYYEENDHCIGYGYYYGHNSSNLTSSRCRTVIQED